MQLPEMAEVVQHLHLRCVSNEGCHGLELTPKFCLYMYVKTQKDLTATNNGGSCFWSKVMQLI